MSDLSSDKLGAKIRNARLQRYPYMLVVGPQGGRGADASGSGPGTPASSGRCPWKSSRRAY